MFRDALAVFSFSAFPLFVFRFSFSAFPVRLLPACQSDRALHHSHVTQDADISDEWLEWYGLTPQERWRESGRLWTHSP